MVIAGLQSPRCGRIPDALGPCPFAEHEAILLGVKGATALAGRHIHPETADGAIPVMTIKTSQAMSRLVLIWGLQLKRTLTRPLRSPHAVCTMLTLLSKSSIQFTGTSNIRYPFCSARSSNSESKNHP